MIYEKAQAAAQREMLATGEPIAIIQGSRKNVFEIARATEAQAQKAYVWWIAYPEITCVECGERYTPGVGRDINAEVVERKLCFTCLQWIWMVDSVNHPNNVRVKGSHYTICLEDVGKAKRGFNGYRYYVQFEDGRVVTTTNLWSQGAIPNRFRERLPDNAKFIGKDEYERLTATPRAEGA